MIKFIHSNRYENLRTFTIEDALFNKSSSNILKSYYMSILFDVAKHTQLMQNQQFSYLKIRHCFHNPNVQVKLRFCYAVYIQTI